MMDVNVSMCNENGSEWVGAGAREEEEDDGMHS